MDFNLVIWNDAKKLAAFLELPSSKKWIMVL